MRFTISLVVAVLLAGAAVAQTNLGIISIDNVDNQYTPGQLVAGAIHRVYIRYDFRGLPSGLPWIGSNSFEVYSPDGADWVYLRGSDGPLVEALPLSVARYRRLWYSSNWGSSWTLVGDGSTDSASGSAGPMTRAAYSLATLELMGVAGFIGGTDNGIAVILEFATNLADYGLTMCVDSVGATIAWEWNSGATMDHPLWNNGLGVSGPRCWEIYKLPCDPPEAAAPEQDGMSPEILCNYCCNIRVGDANGSGEEMPTISDISTVIDAKFIAGSCTNVIPCIPEADINKSGGTEPTCDDITISDISMLIDYLFISGPEGGPLPECY